MNFLRKLFAPREKAAPPAFPTAAPEPSTGPETIRVHDDYGREFHFTREQWRDSVLPGTLKQAWNDPDALCSLIVAALNDGFRSEVVKAAARLHEIDSDPERGTCLWGVVLLEEGRLDEAQAVFEDHQRRRGESGVILTNLAKVYSKRGLEAKAEAMLWRSLERDPNQDNGLGWFAAVHRDRGGEAARLAALRRVSALPGSWRAQLWLARHALQDRDLAGALGLYREALQCMNPPPADALMQISGDLGNTGHLPELLELVLPCFHPSLHGLQVGNNLIKAHLDLGQIDASRRILDQLYALNRPDWKAALAFWETELAKAHLATALPVSPQELKIAMATIEGPIWLKPTSPAAELFPSLVEEPVRVGFLGSSAESPTNSQRVEVQLADARGRLARAIPLFLAEQAEFFSDVRSRTLVPLALNEPGGFVLASHAWGDEPAAEAARNGDDPCDYVVVSHLQLGRERWKAQLRLVRTIDAVCMATAEAPIDGADPAEGAHALAAMVLALLVRESGACRQEVPAGYVIPEETAFPDYLLRLEQLLAVRNSALAIDQGRSSNLNGEREILDGNLHLALAHPASLSVRILMAQTFWTMRFVRPGILPEFRQRVERLQREHPLPEPAQSVLGRILSEAFSG